VTGITREGELPPENDATSVIVATLAPLAGKRILDIGCGTGVLGASLSARGAIITGIYPNSDALSIAPRVVPAGTLRAETAFRRYARAAADSRMLLEQPMRVHVLTTKA
jgi:predicted RNA methylase